MGRTGVIFDISHYMLEDGPGIRTNVFFKGCNLRCKWCSNVYGLEQFIQLSYDSSKCTGCGKCLNKCCKDAIGWDGERQVCVQNFDLCANCLACVEVCHSKARKQIGLEMTVDEIVLEIEKDRMFYRRGDGGVTLSGGEILMQPFFASEILEKCKENGINTAVETSGCGKWDDLKRIIDSCDSVFIDCKCMDDERHRELTGVGNKLIIDNIINAAEHCMLKNVRLIIRLPLIPGMNDDRENVTETAGFVSGLAGDPLLNILPYHNFGVKKYEYIGKECETKDLEPQDGKRLDEIRSLLDETNVNYSIGGYDI